MVLECLTDVVSVYFYTEFHFNYTPNSKVKNGVLAWELKNNNCAEQDPSRQSYTPYVILLSLDTQGQQSLKNVSPLGEEHSFRG